MMIKLLKNRERGTTPAKKLTFMAWTCVLVLFGFILTNGSVLSQTITSNGTGGGPWTSATTWAGGVVPDSTNCTDVVIASGDSVSTNLTGLVSCVNIEIKPGAKLAVFGPSSGGGGLRVTGAFTIDSSAWFYNAYSSLTGWPSNAASYTIDPNSNYVLTSSGSSTLGSSSSDSLFGNVYILITSSTCGANLTIQGNLIINTGSSGNTFRGIGLTDARQGIYRLVHHVKGNVNVITGQWSCVDYDTSGGVMTCIWNVDGNVTVGDPSTSKSLARMGPFSSASTLGNSRIGIFNINGNLSFVNGGRMQAGTSSTAPSTAEIGELNLRGNLTLDNTALVTGNSSGSYAINFVGNKPQTVSLGVPIGYTPNSGGYYPTLCDTIASSATVIFTGGRPWGGVTKTSTPPANGWGQWVVNGKLMLSRTDSIIGTKSFILNKGATLGIGSREGITAGTAPGDTVGNILVSGSRIFSSGANYIYDGDSSQVTGNGLPSTVNNLTITDTAGVTLTASDTVAGMLILSGGGKLITGSNSLFVSNPQANAVVGDSASYVVGALTRAQGTSVGSYQFPIGTSTGYHGATLNFTAAASASTNLTVAFTDGDPTLTGTLPAGISGYWKSGYWTVSSTETPSGVYDLTLYAGGVPGIDTGGVAIMQKTQLTDPWLKAGSGTNVTGNYATAVGVTSVGVFGFGFGKILGILNRLSKVPSRIALSNFPNPFNPTTQIQFSVPKSDQVTLTIYNDLGQKVETLVDQKLAAGVYEKNFDGSRYASGVYFARLVVGNHAVVGKMLMVK
jgi:hypothetical protein